MTKEKPRGRIGRTFFRTRCIGRKVSPSNELQDFEVEFDGNIKSLEQATKRAQRHFGTTRLVVLEIHHKQTYESAPIEAFRSVVDEINVIEED